VDVKNIFTSHIDKKISLTFLFLTTSMKKKEKKDICYFSTKEMPVPSQGHYGFHSFPVVD
jgi:hypothetical protein